MARSLKVAVIGAGVAGLAAARELRSESHRVVVYEKAGRLGGTWVYDPRVEVDPLGLEPDREIVHGSLYQSLRTNLPRPIMCFSDYPLTIKENGDPRYFPGHEEVLRFLNEFARDFGLTELIRFNTEVVRVEPRNDEWVVESRASGVSWEQEVFEAVVVCNGHHTQPRLANISGIEKWSGKQVHSHNYRVPEPFHDQVVVMIGSGPSAYDISREIVTVAKEVHLSSRSPDVKVSKSDKYDNLWQHSKAIIFLMLELQCKWVARVLSGKVALPSEEEMLVDVQEQYRQMEECGIPKHHTHSLNPLKHKHKYHHRRINRKIYF